MGPGCSALAESETAKPGHKSAQEADITLVSRAQVEKIFSKSLREIPSGGLIHGAGPDALRYRIQFVAF